MSDTKRPVLGATAVTLARDASRSVRTHSARQPFIDREFRGLGAAGAGNVLDERLRTPAAAIVSRIVEEKEMSSLSGRSEAIADAEQASRAELSELFESYRLSRDRTTRNRLVEEHMWLAERCARRFANKGEQRDDVEQVAFIGLVKAVDRFEPDRHVAFASFATPTILGEIRRHFRDRTWSVKVPRAQKDLRPSVFAAIDTLHQRSRRSPTPDEVARYVGVDRDDVIATLDAGRAYRSASIDRPAGDADDGRPSPFAPAAGVDVQHAAEQHVIALAALNALSERSREIVYLRFFEDLTQREIGERLGLGQVQVSRLLRTALKTLREQIDGADATVPRRQSSVSGSRPG